MDGDGVGNVGWMMDARRGCWFCWLGVWMWGGGGGLGIDLGLGFRDMGATLRDDGRVGLSSWRLQKSHVGTKVMKMRKHKSLAPGQMNVILNYST